MDDERFEALYAETVQDVWRFVRRRTHGSAEADDVTAEIYATAWRRRHELPPDPLPEPSDEEKPPRSTGAAAPAVLTAEQAGRQAGRQAAGQAGGQARLWLFGTARLTLSNHHRDAARRDRLHLRIAATDPPPATYQPAPRIEDERAAACWAAMAALSEQDRELLLLRAWDGLSVADIAALLHLSAPLVSSRLHQARGRLRRHLHEQHDPPHRSAATQDQPRDQPRDRQRNPQRDPQRDPRGTGHVGDEPRMERSTR